MLLDAGRVVYEARRAVAPNGGLRIERLPDLRQPSLIARIAFVGARPVRPASGEAARPPCSEPDALLSELVRQAAAEGVCLVEVPDRALGRAGKRLLALHIPGGERAALWIQLGEATQRVHDAAIEHGYRVERVEPPLDRRAHLCRPHLAIWRD
jgi:hypothetical protein